MLVGHHALERGGMSVQPEDLINRQCQPAIRQGRKERVDGACDDLLNLGCTPCTEGNADIADATQGMKVEIHLPAFARHAPDIDNASADPGGLHVAVHVRTGEMIYDKIHTLATACRRYLSHPVGRPAINRMVGTKLTEAGTLRIVGMG